MNPEFENYELLEPIPRIYGYSGALVSFLAFLCIRPAVERYAIPDSVTEGNRWKWKNILLSWSHSFVVGAWVLSCFYFYPEVTQDLIAFHNPYSYGVVSFATGYFFSDFLDIVLNFQAKANWEVLLHHVAVLSIFLYNITACRYIGYTNVALLVEVHSVSMHLRKMMQLAGVSFQNRFYKANNVVNILMFLGFRIFALVWITYALMWNSERMSTFYFKLLSATMFVMWVINLVLLWRLIKSDILRNLHKGQSVENGYSTTANDNNNKATGKRQKHI